jgi:hypothetical protein
VRAASHPILVATPPLWQHRRDVKLTDYHAKYFAHELTRRCPSDSVEKLAGAVTGAQVDLNPHQEKFFLPCEILEAKSYNAAVRQGKFQPFETERIVICSYQFARGKASDIANTPWDLVVLDEAHRLRNVYKPSNVIANTLKLALAGKPKLLLTATPLQNSLLELFGLVKRSRSAANCRKPTPRPTIACRT